LEIDNNRSERSIEPVVIGRKNWLFANTPRGTRASAIIYSIVETAKANSLNPYYYIRYLFEQFPNMDTTDENALGKLLHTSCFLHCLYHHRMFLSDKESDFIFLFRLGTLKPKAMAAPIQLNKHPINKYRDGSDSPIKIEAIPPIAGNKATI
jgi:hypothetical protein